ncbi:hypothetical protein HYH03_016931 [Edaphochlamys debaryana]|uniref:Uncharacterized protein n=1 Tax=Edaphochlamys debaryana TaxID=47281 RepID=A0A836BPT6_9CHLO|nr:hypothetical protein HYH03_016931 [Edaphochlamys debaryana]|eukprot:KAG2484287.1 hypothetical protein HYH03_016931 [Edaphochlamys debaryana]
MPYCDKAWGWKAPLEAYQGHIYYDRFTRLLAFEPDGCALRRLGGAVARRCLAQLGPVAFIGDSVTRYQFLTLVHFLASGVYQYPLDGKRSLSNVYKHRVGGPKGGTPEEKSAHYARLYTQLWEEAKAQVEAHAPGRGRLFFSHDRVSQREHAHLELTSKKTGAKTDLYYNFIARANLSSVQGAVEWVLSKKDRPPLLLLSACAHYGEDGATMVKDVTESLQWVAQRLPPETQLVWRTCTTPLPEFRATVDVAEAAIRAFIAAHLPRVAVHDLRSLATAALDQGMLITWSARTVHFRQWVYEQFNDLLLNVICD